MEQGNAAKNSRIYVNNYHFLCTDINKPTMSNPSYPHTCLFNRYSIPSISHFPYSIPAPIYPRGRSSETYHRK